MKSKHVILNKGCDAEKRNNMRYIINISQIFIEKNKNKKQNKNKKNGVQFILIKIQLQIKIH